jgi:hypothetical protein
LHVPVKSLNVANDWPWQSAHAAKSEYTTSLHTHGAWTPPVPAYVLPFASGSTSYASSKHVGAATRMAATRHGFCPSEFFACAAP